jgi:hypothetical protein
MRMGHWSSFKTQEPFDGSVCQRCWYRQYNDFLAGLLTPIENDEFV